MKHRSESASAALGGNPSNLLEEKDTETKLE
jgi:hypothetical protein